MLVVDPLVEPASLACPRRALRSSATLEWPSISKGLPSEEIQLTDRVRGAIAAEDSAAELSQLRASPRALRKVEILQTQLRQAGELAVQVRMGTGNGKLPVTGNVKTMAARR